MKKLQKNFRTVISTLSCVIALAVPQMTITKSARAQEALMLEEIIVTARKREESVQDIPASVSMMSQNMIERSGIISLNDISRQTPNLVLNRRQDNEPNVVMRGVGSFGNTQGVGFYINDVQNFTDQSSAMRDLARIEILKGPQGTLYGGNNVGGAIRFISKRPGSELSGDLSLQLGEWNTRSFEGAVDIPLIAGGVLDSRIFAFVSESDGYMENAALGTDANPSEERGLRATFAASPSDQLDIDLLLRYTKLENGGQVYSRVNSGRDYRYETETDEPSSNDRTVIGAVLDLSYELGSGSFHSITSYTERETSFLWDLDFTPADVLAVSTGAPSDTTVTTQEFRFASSMGEATDWMVGLYYAEIEDRLLTLNFDLALGVAGGGPLFIPGFNSAGTVEEQYAAFASVEHRIDKFTIGGGIRLNRAEFQAENSNVGLNEDIGEDVLLPKLSLAYDISESWMIYASVAEGFEPGGINTANDAAGLEFDSESARSYELGTKGEALDGKLTFDFAAFYIDYTDRRFETQVPGPDGVIIESITNVGDSETLGLEGSLNYLVTESLVLSASGGYLDSEWKDGAIFSLADVAGNDAPNAPAFSGTLAVDYSLPITAGVELGLRADLYFSSSFYWDPANLVKQPAYEVLNLSATVGNPASGWSLALRARNVLDEEYNNEFLPAFFGELGADGTCDQCNLATVGAPRFVSAELNYRF